MRHITNCSILAAVAIAGLGTASSASAADTFVSVSAFVPIRCEMSFVPAIAEIGGVSTLGTVQQYCNTRFQLRFTHQPLSNAAVLGLGAASASAGSGSTLIEPNGKPVISSSNLWLANGADGDAQKFASSVVIEVTPIGF